MDATRFFGRIGDALLAKTVGEDVRREADEEDVAHGFSPFRMGTGLPILALIMVAISMA